MSGMLHRPRKGDRRPPGTHLPAEVRQGLREVVAERPGLSSGQVVKLVEARTGRVVSRETARAYRLGLHSEDPNHLSGAERMHLRRLFSAAGPKASRREVARLFAAQTGRAITDRSVSRFASDVMGYPPKIRREAPRPRM